MRLICDGLSEVVAMGLVLSTCVRPWKWPHGMIKRTFERLATECSVTICRRIDRTELGVHAERLGGLAPARTHEMPAAVELMGCDMGRESACS